MAGSSSELSELSLRVPGHASLIHFVHVVPGYLMELGNVTLGTGGLREEVADFVGHALSDQGRFFLLDVGQLMHYEISLPLVSVGVRAWSVVGEGELPLVPGDQLVAVGWVVRLSLGSLVERFARRRQPWVVAEWWGYQGARRCGPCALPGLVVGSVSRQSAAPVGPVLW